MEYIRRTNVGLSSREGLSPRQTQILRLIAEGKTTKAGSLRAGNQRKNRRDTSIRSDEADRCARCCRPGRYAVKVGLVDLHN